MTLVEEAQRAARLLLDHAYVRVVARAEPDAVCAAALLGHALRRESIDFHLSWVPRLTAAKAAQLAEERNDILVAIGLAGDAEAPIEGRRIALDREPSAKGAEATLDAREGEAQPASLSALAYLVAVAISKRSRDLAPLALAGAISTRAPLAGLDASVLSEAEESGIVLKEARIALAGTTLAQALAQLDTPYVAGVTGRARNVKKLLADLQLSGDAPPGALQPAQAERLGSFLALRLLQQRAPDVALDALLRPGLRALQGPCTGLEAGDLARLVEAACSAGRCGLGFAALWPDPAVGGELVEVATAAREELVAALMRAERDAKREGKLVVSDAPRAQLVAPLADRLAVSLVGEGHVAVAHHVEGETLILALRGHPQGPDVAAAARYAAQVAGGRARGMKLSATVVAAHGDLGRMLKALAEAIP
jgi:hypothetical protein